MGGFPYISSTPPAEGFIRTLFRLDTGADSGAFRGSEEWSSSESLGDRGTVRRFGQYLVGGASYSFVDGSTLGLETGADSNLDVKNAGQVLLKECRQRRLMKKLGG